MASLDGMRSRIVRPAEMREIFGTEVRGFDYAFVLPAHGSGWDGHALVPSEPAGHEAQAVPRRRSGDKQPVYIEIKAKA